MPTASKPFRIAMSAPEIAKTKMPASSNTAWTLSPNGITYTI
jgi:hypothetical protein